MSQKPPPIRVNAPGIRVQEYAARGSGGGGGAGWFSWWDAVRAGAGVGVPMAVGVVLGRQAMQVFKDFGVKLPWGTEVVCGWAMMHWGVVRGVTPRAVAELIVVLGVDLLVIGTAAVVMGVVGGWGRRQGGGARAVVRAVHVLVLLVVAAAVLVPLAMSYATLISAVAGPGGAKK